jgi:xylose dehydrogenase (NAD/NADP)
MAKELRWGILGTGNIATQFMKGLAGSARNSAIAVGSRKQETADAFARSHRLPSAHGNYEALLADPKVDAIYNSLPNSMHYEWTLKALKAGKHVLCEKPLAANAAQATEMFHAADKAHRLLVEAFMYRSNPQDHAVVRAIAEGAIGELRLIRTSFCYRTTKVDGNIRFNRDLAGGALMDIGCYCVNFSRHFANAEPTRVTASGRFHESGIDILTVGTLEFANGILASFTCGMNTHADNTAYLCGSDGYIEIPVPWKPPAKEAVFMISKGAPPKMDGPNKPTIAPPRQTVRVPVNGELYGFEADDFAAAVLDNQTPRITQRDTLGNMKVLDQLRQQIGLKFPTDP